MAFPNNYTHRRVADSSARACEICYKPSTSVLITPENKDFFYVCPVHLKDRGFCTPIIDQEAVAARKKQKEMDEEMARVKEEYEKKQREKKEKEEKEKKKDKKDGKKDEEGKDKDKDGKEQTQEESKSPPAEDEPRVFELKRQFYLQRVEKKRQAEMAKRNRERLANPSYFPSVPKGLP